MYNNGYLQLLLMFKLFLILNQVPGKTSYIFFLLGLKVIFHAKDI